MDSRPLAERSVTELAGVGPGMEQKLQRLGIRNWQDMLFHLPLRYEDRTRLTPIGSIRPYQWVQIEGEIAASAVALGRRRSLVVKIADGTGIATLRFFHFNRAQQQSFVKGRVFRCYGEARPGANGLELYHPECRAVPAEGMPLADRLTPLYPATDGVGQNRLRQWVKQAIDALSEYTLPDLVNQNERPPQLNISLHQALRELHSPPVDASWQSLEQAERPGQQLLCYEELLAHQLSMLQLRQQIKHEECMQIEFDESLQKRLLAQLGFQPTSAQLRVAAEIQADLASGFPMMRLLQGDVGSGKTLVAAMAAIQSIAAGYQVALMVPTEILAEQHLRSFGDWFRRLGFRVLSLTGRHKGKARSAILDMLKNGEANLVIGTHALFQDDVHYHRLALVIVDEQHRFGVGQRFALTRKVTDQLERPHQLVMTATPIPRTLAMSHYASLDVSVIDEFPAGRKPVDTVLISRDRREEVIESVRSACREGRQVYWVCPLIEESENFDLQAAELAADELRLMLPELGIGLLHGRMKPNQKDDVMSAFRSGELQLLVSTTVIEVGVDVPNASLMVIENPERLGLAQLHQLRGRVGRGEAKSHCVLLYGNPLSDAGRERLKAMRETSDGFRLAEIDLAMRGPGELLGLRQTGEVAYRIADLIRDQSLLQQAKRVAPDILKQSPQRASQLIDRWVRRAEDFASV